MSHDSVKELTDSDFEASVKEGVSLVDFWAPWCGPCQLQIPIIDEVAGQIGDKASICKVNVDENQAVAAGAGVQSIPTLIVYKDGKAVKTFVGVQQADVLLGAINEALAQ